MDVADDGEVFAEQCVEQCAFAGVGGPDDGHGHAVFDGVAQCERLFEAGHGGADAQGQGQVAQTGIQSLFGKGFLLPGQCDSHRRQQAHPRHGPAQGMPGSHPSGGVHGSGIENVPHGQDHKPGSREQKFLKILTFHKHASSIPVLYQLNPPISTPLTKNYLFSICPCFPGKTGV